MPTSVIPGETDLATMHRDLAALWHPDNAKTPQQVSSGSDYRAKWLCATCGQISEATVFRRAREGMGCPICAGRVIIAGVNDLATLRPEIAAQFVRDPLAKHNPSTVPVGSNQRFEWQCDVCTHVWEQRVNHRTAGRGCPACSGKVVAPGINDLATKFPNIAAELDDETYTADQLLPNSNFMVGWKCAKGHTWKARVFNRTRGDNGCNTCVRKEFSSVFERDILALVTSALPSEDITATARSVIKNRELDIYIPGRGIAIEANGVYWHTEKFGKTERYHADKAEACTAQGINLITIWEDDWKSRRQAAEMFILSMLNLETPGTLRLDTITLDEANAYLSARTLEEPVQQNTSKAFPLTAVGAHMGEELAAVIIYRKTTERALRIERYAADGASPRYLDTFVTYLEATVTGYDHFLYDDSAERSQRAAFEANGFSVRNKLNPRHTLVKGSTRYAPGAPEVNDGAAYEKAWDCGGAVYRRERKNPVAMSVTVQAPELLDEWRSDDILPDETLIGSGKVVQWECPEGHKWESKVFERTKRGRKCPVCKHQKVTRATPSKAPRPASEAPFPLPAGEASLPDPAFEQGVAAYVQSIVPSQTVIQPARGIVKGHELDIYLPGLGIAIEANGVYWHSEAAGKKPGYHKEKADACAAAGIRLVQVWEDDWKVRRGVVEKMLAHKLGVSQLPMVPARKTTATSITQSEAQSFLTQNHIQGYASGSHYLALQAGGQTVAVMVLKKTGQPGILRLERYATSARVPGGQSKLIRHAERSLPDWQKLVTFADREVSDGHLYEASGWVRDGELAPDYRYLYGGERRHKFGFRLKRFRTDPKLQYVDGYSERELALLNRIPRIWDSGKVRYVYHRAAEWRRK